MGGLMAKYQEVPITGSQWTQLGKAKILFSPDHATQILFNEEQVRVIDGQKFINNKRELNISLDPLNTKFILVDPDDNSPTGGDMTYRQLEKAIYSLYYAEAVKLDQLPQG
jgi:hypothetical protein